MFIINFILGYNFANFGLKTSQKKYLVTIALIVSYAFSTNVNATSILLLGDSLSASRGMSQDVGWVNLLNIKFKQHNSSIKIINASISGETTAGGLARLSNILAKENVDYLLIELGGNDGLRGFPPKLIKNNLLQIIKVAQAKNIKTLVMDMRIPPNYGIRYNKLFNNVFNQAAKETNSILMPFFIKDIAIKPDLMQQDGIHPNKKAQLMIVDLMFEQLIKIIKPELVKE